LDAEIIVLCVRWYITYRLSYLDLAATMAESVDMVSHITFISWVIRYAPEFEKRWNRFSRSVGCSWRIDETYIAIEVTGTTFTGQSISMAGRKRDC